MNNSNFQKSLDNVKKLYEMLDECEFLDRVGNYGYIVKKEFIVKYVDKAGNLKEKKVNRYNILNQKQEPICEKWFDVYCCDSDGNCIIGYEKSHQLRQIFGDYNGEIKIPGIYPYVYGAVNRHGNLSIQPLYDKLFFGKEDTFITFYGGCYGYVDAETGLHIVPIVFEEAKEFSSSLGCVCYKGQYGYVHRYNIMTNPDSKFQYAIAPQYDQAESFQNGLAKVYKKDLAIKINKFNIEQSNKTPQKTKHHKYGIYT